jgi:hypothetical protein
MRITDTSILKARMSPQTAPPQAVALEARRGGAFSATTGHPGHLPFQLGM